MAKRDLGLCYACEEYPARHRHHVVPREYGGQEEGKKVNICPTCHDLIHQVAEQAVDTGEIPDDLTTNQRILVQYIIRAKLEHLNSGKEKADTARNQIQIKLTNQELAMVHSIKKTKGFNSLERYIKDLIFDDIKRQHKATKR